MYVVELPTPFASGRSKDCPTCLKTHAAKSLHLRLDSNGDVFVTPGVLETLKTVFLAGLEIMNEVEKPPPLVLGAVDQPTLYLVENRINKSLTAMPWYIPGRNKYENAERMSKSLARLFKKEH